MLAGRLSHLFMLTPQGVDQAYLALVGGGIVVEAPPEEQPSGVRHLWFGDHDGRRLLVARR